MSDSFDKDWDEALAEELSGAFRDDPALAGWEFTPAMQQSVLDRIRAEQPDVQPAPAKPRPFRWTLPRPLVWATVAAAAFLIVVQAGPGLFRVGSSKPMAPKMTSSAPDQKAAAPTAVPAAPEKGTERAANPPAQAPAAKTAAQAPAGKTAPESRAGANATAAGDDAGVASFSAGDATATGAPGTVTTLAVPTPQRVVVAGTDLAVELTPGLVRGFGAGQGELRWERPLEGVTAQSRVVTSPDGSLIAILTQSEQAIRLWVLDSQGRPLYNEILRAVPDEITFQGANLRIVVNGEVQVRVIPQGP